MAQKPLDITTPVGRLVAGSIYEPKTTDFEGKPLTVKTGANAGQARQEFAFAIAIAKNPGETHFSQHPFFAPIWAFAHAAFPAGEAQNPAFAWKIQDGDSTIPNKRQTKNCDREGYPGHWIIWFSSGTAPKVYNRDGSALIMEKDAVKRGYYVQVFGNVNDNKPSQSPGLFINHRYVALAAYGEEIVSGPDVSAAGFGQGVALPPGASAVPLTAGIPATGATPPPPPVPGMAYPAAPVAQVPPPLPLGSVQPPAPPAPIVAVPVTPNPSILAIPVPAVAPPPSLPLAPPPIPARVMTAAAGGQPYEAFIAQNWTDALLIQHGMMLP